MRCFRGWSEQHYRARGRDRERAPIRHAEIVSASILRIGPKALVKAWTLTQVQGDGRSKAAAERRILANFTLKPARPLTSPFADAPLFVAPCLTRGLANFPECLIRTTDPTDRPNPDCPSRSAQTSNRAPFLDQLLADNRLFDLFVALDVNQAAFRYASRIAAMAQKEEPSPVSSTGRRGSELATPHPISGHEHGRCAILKAVWRLWQSCRQKLKLCKRLNCRHPTSM